MIDPRERLAIAVQQIIFEETNLVLGSAHYRKAADRILALPEIAEALKLSPNAPSS